MTDNSVCVYITSYRPKCLEVNGKNLDTAILVCKIYFVIVSLKNYIFIFH